MNSSLLRMLMILVINFFLQRESHGGTYNCSKQRFNSLLDSLFEISITDEELKRLFKFVDYDEINQDEVWWPKFLKKFSEIKYALL
jgi:hypothetical protein